MKSRWIIGLLITGALVISVGAQENSAKQVMDGVVASLPKQQSNSTPKPLIQLQATPVFGNTETYLQQMQGVLEAKVYSMLTSEQQQEVDELRRQSLTSVKASFPDWAQE